MNGCENNEIAATLLDEKFIHFFDLSRFIPICFPELSKFYRLFSGIYGFTAELGLGAREGRAEVEQPEGLFGSMAKNSDVWIFNIENFEIRIEFLHEHSKLQTSLISKTGCVKWWWFSACERLQLRDHPLRRDSGHFRREAFSSHLRYSIDARRRVNYLIFQWNLWMIVQIWR